MGEAKSHSQETAGHLVRTTVVGEAKSHSKETAGHLVRTTVVGEAKIQTKEREEKSRSKATAPGHIVRTRVTNGSIMRRQIGSWSMHRQTNRSEIYFIE